MPAHDDPVGPIEILSQLIADEITLLSTGMKVVPGHDGAKQSVGNALDRVMHLLEQQLGSTAAAQQWLLRPRLEFADRSAGEMIARGSESVVLAAARRAEP